jgi:adenine deaminase
VRRTWIDGQLVADRARTTIPRVDVPVVNKFVADKITAADVEVPLVPPVSDTSAGTVTNALAEPVSPEVRLQVIEALDGQLITNRLAFTPKIVAGRVVSDVGNDVLKLVVVNRYSKARPAVAFIKNFGLRRGAIASSVAHDSHNVIAVGVDDVDIAAAVNLVMEARGGLAAACASDGVADVLPLPIAGLMATGTCEEVGQAYSKLDKQVKDWGSQLRAPYMTLSFMALLVIPALKLSDRGLFDGAKFEFTPLLA